MNIAAACECPSTGPGVCGECLAMADRDEEVLDWLTMKFRYLDEDE